MAKEGKQDPLCGWCMQTVTDLEDRVVSHCSLEGECTGGPDGVVCHYECAPFHSCFAAKQAPGHRQRLLMPVTGLLARAAMCCLYELALPLARPCLSAVSSVTSSQG